MAERSSGRGKEISQDRSKSSKNRLPSCSRDTTRPGERKRLGVLGPEVRASDPGQRSSFPNVECRALARPPGASARRAECSRESPHPALCVFPNHLSLLGAPTLMSPPAVGGLTARPGVSERGLGHPQPSRTSPGSSALSSPGQRSREAQNPNDLEREDRKEIS